MKYILILLQEKLTVLNGQNLTIKLYINEDDTVLFGTGQIRTKSNCGNTSM